MASPDTAALFIGQSQSLLRNPKLATASPQLQAQVRLWAADPRQPAPAGMFDRLLTEGVISRAEVNWWKTLAPAAAVGTFGLYSALAGGGPMPAATATGAGAPTSAGTAGGTMAGATGVTGGIDTPI